MAKWLTDEELDKQIDALVGDHACEVATEQDSNILAILEELKLARAVVKYADMFLESVCEDDPELDKEAWRKLDQSLDVYDNAKAKAEE